PIFADVDVTAELEDELLVVDHGGHPVGQPFHGEVDGLVEAADPLDHDADHRAAALDRVDPVGVGHDPEVRVVGGFDVHAHFRGPVGNAVGPGADGEVVGADLRGRGGGQRDRAGGHVAGDGGGGKARRHAGGQALGRELDRLVERDADQ